MANACQWFEIPVTDLARATDFYQDVLLLQLRLNEMGAMKMAWFPWEQEGTGATGSLVQGPGYMPALEGSVIYLTVPDLDATLTRVTAKGGQVLVPRTAIGEHGFIAYFRDSEGNRLGLHAMA